MLLSPDFSVRNTREFVTTNEPLGTTNIFLGRTPLEQAPLDLARERPSLRKTLRKFVTASPEDTSRLRWIAFRPERCRSAGIVASGCEERVAKVMRTTLKTSFARPGGITYRSFISCRPTHLDLGRCGTKSLLRMTAERKEIREIIDKVHSRGTEENGTAERSKRMRPTTSLLCSSTSHPVPQQQ